MKELASIILEKIGGKDNVTFVSHCMTRLRFNLKDESIPNDEEIKGLSGIIGVVRSGGQYQIIVGPTVANLYDEMIKLLPDVQKGEIVEPLVEEKKSIKTYVNNVFNGLASCMTPLIPILLCMGILKTVLAIFGPQMLGVLTEQSSLYILFTFVSDAVIYFLPVYVGYTAAHKFGLNPVMGMLLGGVLIHPTFIQMVNEGLALDVYGIPVTMQAYNGTIIPIILSVLCASYVEKLLKKYTPDVLKVFIVPLGTLLIMLPLELCVFGPVGAFLGQYICGGIIALYEAFGPVAIAILSGFGSLIVMCGMHTVLFGFLFMTFPTLGYDAFIIPATMIGAYAGAGVALACILKFKNKENKRLTTGYLLTWIFGGVGEPLLYGLDLRFKTPMYAHIISGAITGFVAGILQLKAYMLTVSNGLYILPAFFGGDKANYIALAVTVVVSLVSGFIVMWFMPLDEEKA